MAKIISNFFFLVLSKGFNIIIPIAATPLIIKNIGIDSFGEIVLIQSICSFFTVLGNYAFDLTAIVELINRKSDIEFKEIITKVLNTKFFVFLISIPIYFIISYSFFEFQNGIIFILSSYLVVFGAILIPDWVFQSFEDMKFIGITNGISKVFYIITIVVLFKFNKSILIPNIVMGISNIIVGVVGWFIIYKRYNFDIMSLRFSMEIIKKGLKENKSVASSNLLVASYGYSGVIILGTLGLKSELGIYGILERIIGLFRSMVALIGQSIYPKLCSLKDTPFLIQSFLRSKLKFFVVPYLLCCVIIILFNDLVADFFMIKDDNFGIYLFLFIISAILEIFIMPFSFTILALNRKLAIFKITLVFTLTNLLLNIILIKLFNINGIIISFIVTQLILLFIYYYYFYKSNDKTFR